MNKHTKLAIILAPFLAIGGFVAAGYYSDYEKQKPKMLILALQGECNITAQDCKLGNGDLRVNLASVKDELKLSTTHPIDRAIISIVQQPASKEQLHPMTITGNALNWITEDKPLTAVKGQSSVRLRLVVGIKNTTYLNEFVSKLSQ